MKKKKLKLIIYFYIYFKAQPYSMITTISQFNPTKPRYRTHKWLRALLNPFQQHQESNHYSIAQLNQSIKQTKTQIMSPSTHHYGMPRTPTRLCGVPWSRHSPCLTPSGPKN